MITDSEKTKNNCEICKRKVTSYFRINEKAEGIYLCDVCALIYRNLGEQELLEYVSKLKYHKSNSTCTIEGCNGTVQAKGLCSKHYKQMSRHGKIIN